MKHNNWLSALLLLVLSGCGGGGSTNMAGGGTGGTGISIASSGTVSAVGSIWVNGIEYDTTGATITLPGGRVFADISGTAGGWDLLPGMVVTVSGTHNGALGQASSVTYSRALVGQVSTVGSGIGGAVSSVTVLGQNVLVDTLSGFTRLNPASGWTPAVGDWVEVSGFAQTSGLLHASFLKRIVDMAEQVIEVSGTVTALDSMAVTLTINGATVVRPPVGYNLAALALNNFVTVSGNTIGAGSTANPVQALTLSLTTNTGLSGSTNQEAEVEGVALAAPDANGEFMLNGQRIVLAPGTLYLGGLASDLLAGVKLEVEGTLAADGRLLALTVKFEDPIEIEAQIASYDAASFTLTGISSAITVYVDPALTEIEPGLSFAANLPVKLRGRSIGTGNSQILATQIKAGDPDSVQLQAKLESVAPDLGSFVVLGTTVTVDPGMLFELSGNPVTAADFFSQVGPGQVIEVDGSYSGANVIWTAVALEE